ncbi:N-formylglutamate amidohydrolase [Acetobacter estunensis]|nr:N-formylglutamate amidohydrolase [Acetobacter estunensis]
MSETILSAQGVEPAFSIDVQSVERGGRPAVFVVSPPTDRDLPLIVSSPHSGRDYEAAFLERCRLPLNVLRTSEDFHVDTLVASAPSHGATLLHANFPRVVCDVNRACMDIDPRMISDASKSGCAPTSRGLAGLGSVPGVVSGGQLLYATRLSMKEVTERLQRFWRPYHETLSELIESKRQRHGFCVLLDVHSMPPGVEGSRADCVIGDRYGTSCDREMSRAIAAVLREQKFQVARNHPFAGGYITTHYGRPREGVQAVQLEICRTLYMHPRNGGGFGLNTRIVDSVDRVIAATAQEVRRRLSDV